MVNNDSEREKIREEAKKILDKFGKSLEKVKFKDKKEKKRSGGFRKEGLGVEGNKEFRDLMFKNAPHKDKDSIIAEKKKW